MKRQPVKPKTAKTRRSCALPRTPALGAASLLRCAGATSTSACASSSCSGPLAPTSRRARQSHAAGALDRLSQRRDFTSPDDYVFVNRLGRRLDGSALRRRVERARDAAGLRPLRFHDLRHTYGSLLVAGGVDLASVKAAMGHSRITTTERYLHARSAGELADRFSRALAGADPATPPRREVVAPVETAGASTLDT